MCGIWAIFGSEVDIPDKFTSAYKIAHRGPDAFRLESTHRIIKNSCLSSHRLAINDDLLGMQTMRIPNYPSIHLVYNGEIYNYKELRKQFDFKYDTQCDGEAIIHLYAEGGIEFAAKHLDGVFSFCLLDTKKRKVFLGRDTFGVKPLFRMYTQSGTLAVCSEAKGLMELRNDNCGTCDKTAVDIFSPGHVETYALDSVGKAFFEEKICFNMIAKAPHFTAFGVVIDPDDVKANIRNLLTKSVRKRMMADRRIGCLLSGGVDSSLIAALTVKLAKEMDLDYKIQTFSIGMEGSSDLPAAKKVADYLGTDHHEVLVTDDGCIEALDNVIYHLESYDVITVRGSVVMYMLCKYIKENTESIVIMSGEGSDEVCQGYTFFHHDQSADESDRKSRTLCQDLHYFDILRVDRTSSACGLEMRVPFLDHRFAHYYLSLSKDLRVPQKGIEKYLMRSAFSDSDLIPEEILWRPKESFSDGISPLEKTWYQVLQSKIEAEINDSDVETARTKYTHNPPQSKEALLYRQIFEKHYPGMDNWVPYFWPPK